MRVFLILFYVGVIARALVPFLIWLHYWDLELVELMRLMIKQISFLLQHPQALLRCPFLLLSLVVINLFWNLYFMEQGQCLALPMASSQLAQRNLLLSQVPYQLKVLLPLRQMMNFPFSIFLFINSNYNPTIDKL